MMRLFPSGNPGCCKIKDTQRLKKKKINPSTRCKTNENFHSIKMGILLLLCCGQFLWQTQSRALFFISLLRFHWIHFTLLALATLEINVRGVAATSDSRGKHSLYWRACVYLLLGSSGEISECASCSDNCSSPPGWFYVPPTEALSTQQSV